MIIHFKTKEGSEYAIDHAANEFHQFTPKRRSGALLNVPVVKIGKRVVLWTPNVEGPNPHVSHRVIQTGVVVGRTVQLG